MAPIVIGYSTGLMNKKFLGIKPCSGCGKFSEYYLSKSYFRINLFWFIPIFGVPTGKYLRCGNCNAVRKLTRDEWKELKESAVGMPKKKQYRQAYEALKQLVIETSAEELTTDVVYNRLLGKLDFADENGHIRQLVDTYLKNSQNAANIAAAAKAPEDVPAVEGEAAQAPAISEPAVRASVSEAPVLVTGTGAPSYLSSTPAAETPVYTDADSGKKPSRWRKLWLIPAILLIPFLLVMGGSVAAVLSDGTTDFVTGLITTLILMGVPLGLDILFFRLALKK